MNEQELISIWNKKRTQIISTQFGPTLVLIAVFTLTALGTFKSADNSARYLALAVVAATGILAIISTYGVTREAEAVIYSLRDLKELSKVGTKISESRELLSLNVIANVLMSLGVFALSAWAILKK
jgi:hypothetical protein